MEIILLTNLAFSVVGFFFILRMWKEVKERRDYYGEHFGIPTGGGYVEEQKQEPVIQTPVQQIPVSQLQGMSMDQLTAMVVKAMQEQEQAKQQEQQPQASGDLQKLIQAVAAQNGGA